MNEYKLLPLDYTTLEPVIDDNSLYIHYNILYKSYLDKLNKLLNDIDFNFKISPIALAKNIDIIPLKDRGEVLYNLGGYLNHSLYFYNLNPNPSTIPPPMLKLIEKYFKSFNNFKEEFIKEALNLKGSGYTSLVLDKNNNLKILNLSNQDTPYYYAFTPIMIIDVWEHSYYLKYTYKKEEYLNNIFNIIDFEKVYNLYQKLKN